MIDGSTAFWETVKFLTYVKIQILNAFTFIYYYCENVNYVTVTK